MRLFHLLKRRPLCNNLHFILIAILLLMLSIKYYFFFIALGIYLIFIVLKTKYIIPILTIILLIVLRYSISLIVKNIEIEGVNQAYITDKDDDSYTCYIGISKILVYDKSDFKPGDIIEVELEFYDDDLNSYQEEFNYSEYLMSKGVVKRAKAKSSKFISSGFSLNSIKYHYLSFLKSKLSSKSYDYIKAIVFGDNNLESNIKDAYSIIGISHILAISGMHIIFLYSIISFILLKIFKYYRSLIPNVLITVFVVIIGAPPSALRALLFLLIGSLNSKGDIRYTKLDILSISLIIMTLFNPYLVYQSGFLLSFLVSFVLIFSRELIQTKNKLSFNYKSYLLIFFSTLPIVISFSNKISILSLLLSPILSVLISYILLPLSFILALIPWLDYFLKYIYIFITDYLVNLSSYNIYISYPSFNIIKASFYYLFFGLFIVSIKRHKLYILFTITFSLYMLLIKYINYIDPNSKVTFIDSGQGDSIYIELGYNKGNMLIDAYNSFYFLKSRGIDKIDYMVLTHSDNDHIGDYKKILERFNVKAIIYPKYDSRIDSYLSPYNNKKIKVDESYKFDNTFKFDILGPINEYSDVNSNSVVLKLSLYNTTILFTGDMTSQEEDDLIEKYGTYLKSDILKVAHHGSDTSSQEKFLDLVSPNDSIISVGKNNSYNLPSLEVVERLKRISNLYMTKDLGNISLIVSKNRYIINTYR